MQARASHLHFHQHTDALSTAPLPAQDPYPYPGPSSQPHGSPTHQTLQLGASCIYKNKHLFHRQPAFTGLPKYLDPCLLDTPAHTQDLLLIIWPSLKLAKVHMYTPCTTGCGRCRYSCPLQQLAPGTWAVNCNPAPAASAEPHTCLTHAGPSFSWFGYSCCSHPRGWRLKTSTASKS